MSKSDIFVFGSNLAGRHGKGAALFAKQNFGAVYGQGEGLQGQSYAIPTKGYRLETLSLQRINWYIQQFLEFAIDHQELTFHVTPVGCGLAGYKKEQIKPMFYKTPENIIFTKEWDDQINLCDWKST